MFVRLLFILLAAHVAESCLQCERTVRLMFDNFVLSEPDALKQIDFQKIVDHALVTYRQASESRMGVVDLTTLYRARTEFQSEFNRFLKRTTGTTTEAIQIMEKGREILEKHLNSFISNGLCPNKCGLLVRRVMDCTSCRHRAYTCPSPTGREDCGEKLIQSQEGDQALLNCFRPWHSLILGTPEYHYFWAPDVAHAKNSSIFKVLVVTKDSSVVLNQLRLDESGTYQCLLQNETGTVFYKVTFLLSVSALQTQSPPGPVPTLPSLQQESNTTEKWREALVPVIAVVTSMCLTISLGLAAYLRKIWKRRTVKTTKNNNVQLT